MEAWGTRRDLSSTPEDPSGHMCWRGREPAKETSPELPQRSRKEVTATQPSGMEGGGSVSVHARPRSGREVCGCVFSLPPSC